MDTISWIVFGSFLGLCAAAMAWAWPRPLRVYYKSRSYRNTYGRMSRDHKDFFSMRRAREFAALEGTEVRLVVHRGFVFTNDREVVVPTHIKSASEAAKWWNKSC